MSYSLNSSKEAIQMVTKGTILGVMKGDTRSLDYSPYQGMYSLYTPYKGTII